jgi:hypothetical protein
MLVLMSVLLGAKLRDMGPSRTIPSPIMTTKPTTPSDGAWHPIHVFFGDRRDFPGTEQEWFSQVGQDQIIVNLLGDNGYFIDLAANHASELSNSLALERHGWNGICIEPNPVYWYGLSHRKCTVVGALVGRSVEKVKAKFRGVLGGIVGFDNPESRPGEVDPTEEWRYTAPLIEVLSRFHVPTTIDYLSLDVEGAEMLIMKDFPFDQYTMKVMTIERPGEDLRELLRSKEYVFLKEISRFGETLWAHKSTGLSPEHPKIQQIRAP